MPKNRQTTRTKARAFAAVKEVPFNPKRKEPTTTPRQLSSRIDVLINNSQTEEEDYTRLREELGVGPKTFAVYRAKQAAKARLFDSF